MEKDNGTNKSIYRASEMLDEALELHRGMVQLTEMMRVAIEDGMPMQCETLTALLNVESLIEMKLDSALSTLETGKKDAAA